MDSDLIKRGLAISYAVSGRVRRIDGEEWIRTSEVRQSLKDVPTVEPETACVAKITFDKEQFQEIVDKAKVEVLSSIERPKGEWKHIFEEDNDVECPFCGFQEDGIYYNFCPRCGADMQGGKVK